MCLELTKKRTPPMAQADIDEVGQYDYVHLISGTTDKLLH